MKSAYRFDRLRFDPDSGELAADTATIRLEPQPARVLTLLLRRAGEVVTREELRREIWPEGTFVDFDRGLNYCVARVRAALEQAAAEPSLVETLPRRGYRFRGVVTRIDESSDPRAEPIANPPAAPVGAVSESAPRPRRPISRGVAAALAAALLLAIVAAALALRPRPTLPTIAVTLFENQTERTDLDRQAQILTDAVVVRLATRAGAWNVVGNAPILATARPMRDLDAIAARLGADYVLLGQIQPAEGGLRILTHFIRLADQKHLWVRRFDSPPTIEAGLPERLAAEVDSAAAGLLAGKR